MKLKFTIDKQYDILMAEEINISRKKLGWLKKQYENNYFILEYTRDEYQKAWDKINDKFSSYIEERTGYNWYYDVYECVISLIHPGISNWGKEPKIVRWIHENPYTQRRITAHELIISHYFEIYNCDFNQHKLRSGQIWALAEIAAYALCSLDKKALKFWPWDDLGYAYQHNYPQITNLQKKLRMVFLKKNFNEYIERGIQLVKKYPKIKP